MVEANRHQQGFSPEWVRAAEARTGDLLTNGTLMQRAAKAVSDAVERVAQETGRDSIVVLVGPGNNGADALYAARNLAEAGFEPVAVQGSTRVNEDALSAASAAGVVVLGPSEGLDEDGHTAGVEAIASADLIVDGLLGIGAEPRPNPPWEPLIDAIGVSHFVVAVDCPTPGVTADLTVTFGVVKTSHLLDPDATGCLEVADIGLGPVPRGEADSLVLSRRFLAWQWPVPTRRDHKYTRGVVGFATGSAAYPGAAVLGTVAALSAGAGMVRYLGPAKPTDAVLAAAPEVVHGAGRVQAWVIGSGIDGVGERDRESDRYLSAMLALTEDVPCVVDAGALAWVGELNRPRGAVTVLTPHAGELVSVLRQFDVDVNREQVEADPVRWAREGAHLSGATVLLKGGATVIADSEHREVIIENRAPAWLATAGTGDVLAGLLGTALAAGVPAVRACALAAYIHGEAARLSNPGGPVRALDVAHQLGRVIAQLASEHSEFIDKLHTNRA